jgi:hypothetical protein
MTTIPLPGLDKTNAMQPNTTSTQKAYIAAGTFLSWFSLIVQFYLILKNRQADVMETIFRYFGFFTILTNIMIALCFTALLVKRNSFFHKPGTQTAIAVYIFVVAAIYNTVLRGLVLLNGWDSIVNELLHVIMPIIFILYWFIYTDKKPVQWKNILPWLIYPLVYIVVTLVRGSYVHFYPYPFLNVDKFGLQNVLVNCVWVSIAFVIISAIFVAIAKGMGRKQG